MANVMREMERLRPVYETGVLRLLLRQHSMMYVALLRAAFDPLTGELPREVLEDRFARALPALVDAGEYALPEGQDCAEAAHRMVADLTREGNGDYAWLANSLDMTSHRFLYRLTASAHRAIDALARLQETTGSLSGAQANSIIMEIEHARVRLTADPDERIRLLEQEIETRRKEIERIKAGQGDGALGPSQVRDVIAVVHKTLRDVPMDLRELVLTERDNGDAVRRRMQSGDIGVDANLAAYHEAYRRSFDQSDGGRRFNEAFQVIITDEGREQIDASIRAIAASPYLAGESEDLLNQIKAELEHIYDGIEDVRQQMRVSDEAIGRLVRQHNDIRYRTMLRLLNRIHAQANAEAKAHPGDDARPYRTDTGDGTFPGLRTRPARSMARTFTPGLREPRDGQRDIGPDLAAMVEHGGPRLRRMAGLIRRAPVLAADGSTVDIAASFNRLPAKERRESELVGFLSDITTHDGERAVWHCVSLDGGNRDWITRPVTATLDELDRISTEE